MDAMNAYQSALRSFLDRPDVRQIDVAHAAKRSQASINRYAEGRRFPDAATAKAIEQATGGAVPFALWQGVAMERLGIAA